MKRATFPGWAPTDVVARWREEKRDADAGYKHKWIATGNPERVAEYRNRAFEIPALLHRLLTDRRMREVWEAVTNAGSIGAVPHTTIFAATVMRAWMGPWREQRWTSAEREAWRREVAELAEQLAAKFQGTAADGLLNSSLLGGYSRTLKATYAKAKKERRAITVEEHEELERERLRMELSPRYEVSQLLRSIGRHGKDYLEAGVINGQRQSLRAYFVRTLARDCGAWLGGPQSRIVAIITAVALRQNITGRQVRRLVNGR